MRAASIIDHIPEGKENAITRDRLCAVTGFPDRKLREEIEQARRAHYPRTGHRQHADAGGH